jgi:hypothetical protein
VPLIHTPASFATAYIAEQIALHQDDQGDPKEMNPFSFPAVDFLDIIHFDQMLHDPD